MARIQPDPKLVIADRLKQFVRSQLQYVLKDEFELQVSQVDTADALKVHIVVRTDKGPRSFTLSVKENM